MSLQDDGMKKLAHARRIVNPHNNQDIFAPYGANPVYNPTQLRFLASL